MSAERMPALNLDKNMIPYDFDIGNKIMIEEDYVEEVVYAWDKAGINYHEI